MRCCFSVQRKTMSNLSVEMVWFAITLLLSSKSVRWKRIWLPQTSESWRTLWKGYAGNKVTLFLQSMQVKNNYVISRKIKKVDLLKVYGLREEYAFISGTNIKCTWNTHRLRIGERPWKQWYIYGHGLPDWCLLDYDNLKQKHILNTVALYIMLDDSGLLCDAYNTTERGEKNCTLIYIMGKDCIRKWLLK